MTWIRSFCLKYSERRKKLDIDPKKVGHHPKKSWTLIQKKLDIIPKKVGHWSKKSWTSSQKKLDIDPKKVGHHPKKSWTLIQKKLDISQKYVRHYLKYALLFKIIFYNKIEFWILPRRSSIFYRILRGRLPHPHKIRFKSDSEISYFFFDLFFFLKAKPIINRKIRKRNSLFPNWI